ncbi:kinesin-like protein KIF3A isoform X2 [Oscarella lobularis]
MDSDEHFSVVVRCRPSRTMTSSVTSHLGFQSQCRVELSTDDNRSETLAYNAVFDSTTDQATFYRNAVRPIVEKFLQGYNGTVIAYGPAGCGKTYTLTGGATMGGRGAVQRAAEQVLNCIRKSRSKSRVAANLVVLVSYVLVLDDVDGGKTTVYDLLNGNESLDVVADDGEIQGVSQHLVSASVSVDALLVEGGESRGRLRDGGVGYTVFFLTVEHAEMSNSYAPISGTLAFVDTVASGLVGAGSGDRRTSLQAIVNVIWKLAYDSSTSRSTTPLTSILHESLGGNCNTLFVCNVEDGPECDETRHALRVAHAASRIKNTANKRDLAEQALMSAYMKELRQKYKVVVVRTREESQKDRESDRQREENTENQTLESCSGGESLATQAASALAEAACASYEEDETETEKQDKPPSPKSESKEGSVNEDIRTAVDDAVEELIGVKKEDEIAPTDTTNPTSATKQDDLLAGDSLSLLLSCFDAEEEPESQTNKDNLSGIDKEASKVQDGIVSQGEEEKIKLSRRSDMSEADIEHLVELMSEPGRGVPRIFQGVQKEANVTKSKNADVVLCSGSSLVDWVQARIKGVESSLEAQTLCQELLTMGILSHSEGSSVFAGAASLFYYIRSLKKSVSSSSSLDKDNNVDEETKNDDEEEEEKDNLFPEKSEEIYEVQETRSQPLDSGGEGDPSGGEENDDVVLGQENGTYWDQWEFDNDEFERDHPLHKAAAKGEKPGVLENMILMCGVDVRDKEGRTPCMYSIIENQLKCLQIFLSCSADIQAVDEDGNTPLLWAVYKGNSKAVLLLLRAGASVGFPDAEGRSAIHWATRLDSTKCLETILKYATKDDVNQQDLTLLAPLHWAIAEDKVEMVRVLLRG